MCYTFIEIHQCFLPFMFLMKMMIFSVVVDVVDEYEDSDCAAGGTNSWLYSQNVS